MKNGEIYIDRENNEYYIIDYNEKFEIVKFYKNFTKDMQFVRVYERFRPITMRISEFMKLIE